MRITSWNFLHGQSLNPADKATYQELLPTLESDLIALQEVDHHLSRTLNQNQSSEAAAAISAQWWGFAPCVKGTPGFKWRALDKREREVLTAANSLNQSELYGIAIISKIAVKSWQRLELGRSLIGMPLLIPNEKGKVAPFYVKDEPRVALAAVLENGWTVINTHLSFVPLVNIYQLLKISRWAKKLSKEHSTKVVLAGDFNLPWGIPSRITGWKRATQSLTYPSWEPKISFDYILLRSDDMQHAEEISVPQMTVSDHRAISVELSQ